MPSARPGTWTTTLTPDLFARQHTISAPRYAPDGRAIAFASEYDGRTDLFVLRENGWPLQITADQPVGGGVNYAWSSDGRTFVFSRRERSGSARRPVALRGVSRFATAITTRRVFLLLAGSSVSSATGSAKSTSSSSRSTARGSACSIAVPI